MFEFLATALLLLSVSLLEATLGPRGRELVSFISLVSLAPVLVYLVAGISRHSYRRVLALTGGAAGVVLWYVASGASRYFALSGALALFVFAQHRDEVHRRCLGKALALTALGYGVFVLIRDYGSLWPILYPMSTSLSSMVASIMGAQARLGPSYSGMWLVVAFAIAFAARATVGHRASRWKTVLALILLVLLPVAAIGLRSQADIDSKIHVPTQFLGWRALQFLLLLLPLALFIKAHPLQRKGSPSQPALAFFARTKIPFRLGSGVMLIAGLTLLAWHAHVPARAGRVLLDSRGNFNLRPLQWGEYGPNAERGASLAALPSLLEARGFSLTVHDTTITASLLTEHEMLVVMNPAYTFMQPELEAIWDFVRRGGGLLVLGDHTNIMNTMEPLNTLLQPFDVRFEFDSAIPQVPRWTWYNCMRIHPHPVTKGIRNETDVKISVGASLDLPLHALPLLTGRDAFSDAGNWENKRGAYLGNMRYDADETLGDLPLAAVVSHGDGKVIVFGDTSTFQRASIYNTHEFVASIFTYLVADGSAVPWAVVRLCGMVAAIIGVAGLMLSNSNSLYLGLLGILGASGLLVLDQHGQVALPRMISDQPVAWIDLDHGNRVDLHSGEQNGISGFVDHLWRSGYLALGMKDFDGGAFENASLFATVAPAIPFTTREIQMLKIFVENGGFLVVATGYEESTGAEALLADFGYAIGATPIGAAHQVETHLEGQRVIMHESWPVLAPDRHHEVWVSCWGYPLVTFETIGRGGLLVIGDSQFLCDRMLESPQQFVEVNIDFLRAALETAWRKMAQEEKL